MTTLPKMVLVEGPKGPIELAVRHSPRAHRVSLKIDRPEGQAVLIVPEGASLDQATAFARRKANWLYRHLQNQPDTVEIGPGVQLPLRGDLYHIYHEARRPRRPAIEGDGIWVGGPVDRVPYRLEAWLKDQARDELKRAALTYAQQSRVQIGQISVRDTKSRWGSASSRGTLSFSWRLILAPPFVLDYLAAHEVAHLSVMNHSPRFWALLNRLCPHVDQAESWLKTKGKTLHRYRFSRSTRQ